MAKAKKSTQLCDRVLKALTLEALTGGDDESFDRLRGEVAKRSVGRNGLSEEVCGACEVLTDRTCSKPAGLYQMTPVGTKNRREPVGIGLHDQAATGSEEPRECTLRSSKQGLLTRRREHRAKFGHRKHCIGSDRSAGVEDLLQSADVIMCRFVRITYSHQPIGEANEPVGNRGLEITSVKPGKESREHHGLHVVEVENHGTPRPVFMLSMTALRPSPG